MRVETIEVKNNEREVLTTRRGLSNFNIVKNEVFWSGHVFVYLNFCRQFIRLLNCFLIGKLFKWQVKFLVIGYHYIIKGSNRLGRLQFRVGLRYRVMLKLPLSISVFFEKRKFVFIGDDLVELIQISKYIKNLRNLLPYKNKGISFEIIIDNLKQGKKSKIR